MTTLKEQVEKVITNDHNSREDVRIIVLALIDETKNEMLKEAKNIIRKRMG